MVDFVFYKHTLNICSRNTQIMGQFCPMLDLFMFTIVRIVFDRLDDVQNFKNVFWIIARFVFRKYKFLIVFTFHNHTQNQFNGIK